MLDIELEEALILKVGGKFKLTTLIQKRMVELNRGAAPLIRQDGMDMRRLVYQEILQDKIQLGPKEEGGYAPIPETPNAVEQLLSGTPPEVPEGSDVFGSDIKKIKEQRIKELSQLLNTDGETVESEE